MKNLKKIIPTIFKAKIKVVFKMAKLRSIKELNYKTSYFAHNEEYMEKEAIEREIKIHKLKSEHTKMKKGIWNNAYSNNKSVGYFLEKNHSINQLIDLGSGTGWFINYVAENFKNLTSVYGIEPSSAAVNISSKIYKGKNSTIEINDFAHVALKEFEKNVYLITTFAVFQHLPRRYTKKILQQIDKISLKGTVLIFNEPIGESNLNNYKLHYARSRKFWKKQLKNFKVDFNTRNLIIATKE
jgi:phospholipid N-methyltransferase